MFEMILALILIYNLKKYPKNNNPVIKEDNTLLLEKSKSQVSIGYTLGGYSLFIFFGGYFKGYFEPGFALYTHIFKLLLLFSLGLYLIIEYYFFKILVTHEFIKKTRFARKAITIHWNDINNISYDINSEKLFVSNPANTIVISTKHKGFIEFIKRVQVKRNDLLDSNIVEEINRTLSHYIDEFPIENK